MNKTMTSQGTATMATPKVETIYTDGACSGNPGPGGWGAIAYLSNGQIHEIGGAAPATTNNRMEIQAAIEILRWFSASPQVTSPILYTDSKYVQDGITKWIKGWKKKNWKTSAGKPVLNQDLWQELDAITQTVNAQLETPVQWRYVKGHAGNEGNERCDAIARGFATGKRPRLQRVALWSNDSVTATTASATGVKGKGNSQESAGGDRAIAARNQTRPDAQNKDKDDETAQLATPHPSATQTGVPQSEAPPSGATPSAATIASTTNGSQTELSSPDLSINVDGASVGNTGAVNVSSANPTTEPADSLPKISLTPIQHILEQLRMADELATNGYWVTTAELASLLNLTPSTINGKGDRWLWRNWSISRVQQEKGPLLWQLDRID